MDLMLESVSLPGVRKYLFSHLESRSAIIKEMEKFAVTHNAPIASAEVGNFLSLLTKISGARNILELGSSIGYSTFWFAESIEEGRVTYTDLSEENAKTAQEFLRKGNLQHKVRLHVGDALAFARDTEEEYDIVFIDLDKELYMEALKIVLPKVKKGGMIIADNTMWGGRVRWEHADQRTQIIKEYNTYTHNSSELQSALIPIKDGLTISIKK